jgi:hypothetical protein
MNLLSTLELLQAENDSLRTKLKALRKRTIHEAPHSDPPVSGTFNFVGLPRELRDAIYELCVVPGTVFIKRPDNLPHLPSLDMRYLQSRQTKAETQLFRVNKKLRLEALEVFLSMNQFVTSAPIGIDLCMYPYPVMSRIPGYQDDSLLTRHLRSISISLNSIENAPYEIMMHRVDITADDYVDTPNNADTRVGDDRKTADRHRRITRHLTARFVATLGRLFAFPGRLRKIQINLEATSCPLGCHRLVKEVFDEVSVRLVRRFATRSNNDMQLLESLDFLGTVSDKERESVRSAFPSFLQESITFHGTYNRRAAEWNSTSRVHTPNMSAEDEDEDEDDDSDLGSW